MRHDLDPSKLSPDERLREVAGILAAGVLGEDLDLQCPALVLPGQYRAGRR